MNKFDLDIKISLRQAYLTMFEYLNNWWIENGKPDAVEDSEISFINKIRTILR